MQRGRGARAGESCKRGKRPGPRAGDSMGVWLFFGPGWPPTVGRSGELAARREASRRIHLVGPFGAEVRYVPTATDDAMSRRRQPSARRGHDLRRALHGPPPHLCGARP